MVAESKRGSLLKHLCHYQTLKHIKNKKIIKTSKTPKKYLVLRFSCKVLRYKEHGRTTNRNRNRKCLIHYTLHIGTGDYFNKYMLHWGMELLKQ